MKIYDGAMLHGVNRQNVAPGELGKTVSLDLGMIPEEAIEKKIGPLVVQLTEALKEYEVYTWITCGYHENKTQTMKSE